MATPDAGADGEIRVLRLFSRLNVGGPSLHVIFLTAGLQARGYRTQLVIGQESAREGNMLPLAEAKKISCVQIEGLGREIRLLSDFRALWTLYRMMREFRPAIVHTHTAKAGVLGRIAARLARVPVVVHTYHGHVLRGYFGPLKTSFFRCLEFVLARGSTALVAVSAAVKQDLVQLGVAPATLIRVIPLGLELTALAGALPRGGLRTEAGVPADAPLVGIVGRLVPIKDLPTFLEAAVLVQEQVPDVRFAIVGDGEERELLQQQSARLGLENRVFFHGWRRDMDAVYGDLDVVVNSSLNEGTPVALIEALAAGKPVVATRVGGTVDLLGDGARGALVPPSDPGALARAIVDALQTPAARERARAGQAYVLARHAVGRLLDDIDGLYRELLARQRVA
jgi:glycosyltransferase involved in cell wall biosynthesis